MHIIYVHICVCIYIYTHTYIYEKSSGGGHGNPLQCSSLESPSDSGAWWAAICGVAQSRTQLK